jgi:hypothetical protein
MTIFVPLTEIVAFSPRFRSVETSGESASRTAAAIRLEPKEIESSAVQLFKVNVVGSRCNLVVALGAIPNA